jgi:hypothetical protein
LKSKSAIIILALYFGFLLLRSQPWYVPFDNSKAVDRTDYWKASETTTLWLLTNYQYIGLTLAYSIGTPFRKEIWHNGIPLLLFKLTNIDVHPIQLDFFIFFLNFFSVSPYQCNCCICFLFVCNFGTALLASWNLIYGGTSRFLPCKVVGLWSWTRCPSYSLRISCDGKSHCFVYSILL